jgi:hypothetical protein
MYKEQRLRGEVMGLNNAFLERTEKVKVEREEL